MLRTSACLIARVSALPRRELWTTAQAAALLAVLAVAVRGLPPSMLIRLVSSAGRPSADPGPGAPTRALAKEAEAVDSVVRAVRRADRWLPGGTCLTRAIAGRVLCLRRGVPCQVRVGVALPRGKRLASHAWLEWRGKATLGGEQAARFATLPLRWSRRAPPWC